MSNAPRRRLDAAEHTESAAEAVPARRAADPTPSFFEGVKAKLTSPFGRMSPQFGRQVVRITVPAVAALALAGTVGGGAALRSGALTAEPAAPVVAERMVGDQVSRSDERPEISPSPSAEPSAEESADSLPTPEKVEPVAAKAEVAKPKASGTRYATTAINVRSEPTTDSKTVGSLDVGEKVSITDTEQDGWQQIILSDEARWVKAEYLSKDKPETESESDSSGDSGDSSSESSSGSSAASSNSGSGSGSSSAGTGGTCDRNLGSKSGLGSAASKTWDAVCANFPNVSTIGGTRGGSGSYHNSGQAIDVMTSGEAGWEIANWARDNASSLGITEVIYSQKIWTTQRSGEGWRSMSDRGSSTANHYDHVHISTK
ncbi:SH3 domain-containing protein [Naumannella halotolerans]|uniref:SH3 domain-containing protein n=1 Tax=Naumannella halotolerans TaxID=993414 RepID=UPI00370D85E4